MIGNNSFLVPVWIPFIFLFISCFSSYSPPALLFVMREKYKNKLFFNFAVALCVPYEIDARKSHSISGDFIFIYCSCCFRIVWGSEAKHACPYVEDSGIPRKQFLGSKGVYALHLIYCRFYLKDKYHPKALMWRKPPKGSFKFTRP